MQVHGTANDRGTIVFALILKIYDNEGHGRPEQSVHGQQLDEEGATDHCLNGWWAYSRLCCLQVLSAVKF